MKKMVDEEDILNRLQMTLLASILSCISIIMLLTREDSASQVSASSQSKLSFVVQSLDAVLLYKVEQNGKIKTTQKIYSSSIGESIDNPQFIKGAGKIIFAVNLYSEKSGTLYSLDMKTGKIDKIITGKIIHSAVPSRDGKYIAYLSELSEGSIRNLYIYDVLNQKSKIIPNIKVKSNTVYNASISWSNDNKSLAYTGNDDVICITNILTGNTTRYVKGYDPMLSPSGKKMLYKATETKPYRPYIYDLETKKIVNIEGRDIMNAIWATDDSTVVIVRIISSIFKFSEWKRAVATYNLETFKQKNIFKFEGYEYIDCEVTH